MDSVDGGDQPSVPDCTTHTGCLPSCLHPSKLSLGQVPLGFRRSLCPRKENTDFQTVVHLSTVHLQTMDRKQEEQGHIVHVHCC